MNEFKDFLQELFEKWGQVTARHMFAGHGMYHEGLTIPKNGPVSRT